jgi:hypothetical protein
MKEVSQIIIHESIQNSSIGNKLEETRKLGII